MNPVLSLFDFTGNMVRPWAEAGHTCYCVDIQHDRVRHENVGAGVIYFIPADILTYQVPALPWAVVFAFPPCTDLSVSGARWFQDKGPRRLVHALDMFTRALEIGEASGAPFMVENPVSVASSHLRKPDHTFHPHDYAGWEPSDNYTKKTCLWTGNGFVMPPKRPAHHLGEPDDRIHKAPPGDDRANFRSATPMGFARAVFAANATAVEEMFS